MSIKLFCIRYPVEMSFHIASKSNHEDSNFFNKIKTEFTLFQHALLAKPAESIFFLSIHFLIRNKSFSPIKKYDKNHLFTGKSVIKKIITNIQFPNLIVDCNQLNIVLSSKF